MQDDKKIISEYEELEKIDIKRIYSFLNEIYGIEINFLESYNFLKKGNDVWITNKKTKNFIPFSNKGITINSIGFRALRNYLEVPKITSNFAIYLNNNIKENIYELNEKEYNQYIHGYDLDKTQEKEYKNNYVILKYKKDVLGVGLLSQNKIKNQIPKGRVLKNQIEN